MHVYLYVYVYVCIHVCMYVCMLLDINVPKADKVLQDLTGTYKIFYMIYFLAKLIQFL